MCMHIFLRLVLLAALASSSASLLSGSAFIHGTSSKTRHEVARAQNSHYPGSKGHKTILFRRNGEEITTADDLFNIAPVANQIPHAMTTPVEKGSLVSSEEEFPTLESTRSTAALATARSGRSSGTAVATWGEPVMVGMSGGGGQLRNEAQPTKPAVSEGSIALKDIVRHGPQGQLPLRGCSWNPSSKTWSFVEIATKAGEQFSMRLMRRPDVVAMKPINFACPYTEQFPRAYYDKYMKIWPDLCLAVQANAEGELAGYVLGKVEMGPEGMYGHVSALTVKAECRRRGVAQRLMAQVEAVCAETHGALYIDLFVKTCNTKAQQFYQRMGYVTYRTIKGYYDDGDALDMRKSLPADRNNKRMEPRDKSWNLQSFMVPG